MSEDALLREIYDYIVKNCGRARGSPYTEESKARVLARLLATRIRWLQEKYPNLDIVEAATSKLDEIIVCTEDPATILSNFELFIKTGFGIEASPGELVEDRIKELMMEREELASRIRELEALPSEELPYWYVDGEPVGTEERRRRILEQWRRELDEYDKLIREVSEQKARRHWSPIEAYTRQAGELKERFEKLQGEINEVFRNFEKKWSEVKPYYERAEQLLKEFEAGRTEQLEREGEAVLSKLRKWLASYSTLEYDLERDLSRLDTEREFLLTDVRILRDKIVRRRLKKITPESLGLTEMERSLSIGAVSGSLGILEDYIKKVRKVKEYVSSLESALKKAREMAVAKPPTPPAAPPPAKPPAQPPTPTPPPAPVPTPEEMRIVMEKRRAFEEYLRARVPRIYRVDWSGFYTARISYHAEVEEALRKAIEEAGARLLRIVGARPPMKVMYADFTPAKIPAPPPTPPTRPRAPAPVEVEEKWKKIVEDARKLVEEWITLYVPAPKAPAVRAALSRALSEAESDVKEFLKTGKPEMAEEEVNRALREVAEVVVSINPKAREHPRIKALIPEKPPAPTAPAPVAVPLMEEIPWWMPGKPPGVGWQTWKWAKYLAKLEDLMRATYERMKYPTIPPFLRGHPNPWIEQFPPLAEPKDGTVELHPTTVAGLVRIAEKAGVKLLVKTEWDKRELLGLIDSLYKSPRLGSHEREWLDLLGKAVRREL